MCHPINDVHIITKLPMRAHSQRKVSGIVYDQAALEREAL